MAGQVRRHGHIHDGQGQGVEVENARLKKMYAEEILKAEILNGDPYKKVVRPSRRRAMARRVVTELGISVRLACQIFTVSETSYRYEAKKNAKNEQIAD